MQTLKQALYYNYQFCIKNYHRRSTKIIITIPGTSLSIYSNKWLVLIVISKNRYLCRECFGKSIVALVDNRIISTALIIVLIIHSVRVVTTLTPSLSGQMVSSLSRIFRLFTDWKWNARTVGANLSKCWTWRDNVTFLNQQVVRT